MDSTALKLEPGMLIYGYSGYALNDLMQCVHARMLLGEFYQSSYEITFTAAVTCSSMLNAINYEYV
jgi:hypothetical protein